MAEAKNSKRTGTAPSVDGVAPDGTTAQAVPAADTPRDAVLEAHAAARGGDATRLRLAQLAAVTPAGSTDPVIKDGTPAYPGPMDGPLPEPGPEDEDVDGGGRQRAQVLFNFYRVNRGEQGRVTARRGQVIRVTVDELERGVALGGLRALE